MSLVPVWAAPAEGDALAGTGEQPDSEERRLHSVARGAVVPEYESQA